MQKKISIRGAFAGLLTSLSIIHLERIPQIRRYWFKCEPEKRTIAVFLSFFFIARHTGTSSAFVKEADRGFQVISAHNPFEIKKNAKIVIFEKNLDLVCDMDLQK